jgi:hypothetical protein
MVIFPRGTIRLMPCRVPDGLSLSHPNNPFSITIAWEPNELKPRNSIEKRLFCDNSEPFSDSELMLIAEAMILLLP